MASKYYAIQLTSLHVATATSRCKVAIIHCACNSDFSKGRNVSQGRIQDFRKGDSFICRAAAEGSAQRCVVLISPHEARKFFFFLYFLGWAHVAPLCFALQVPDVKGFQNWGRHVLPFLAQISLTQRNTYIDVNISTTEFWLVRSGPTKVSRSMVMNVLHGVCRNSCKCCI